MAPSEPHDPSGVSAEIRRLRGLTGVKWTRYPADVLPCWVADMDLPTAPAVTDALRELVERGDFGYNFAAHAALPEVFSGWMAERHGWRPDPAHVRVFCDVLQAVDTALWLGTEPGDGVVLFTPVYPPFFRCIEGIGRRVVDCPLDEQRWHLERDALDEAIDAADCTVRAILLCNPHNPTGRVFGPHELAAVAEVARERDLLVISDEIWADMVFPDGYFPHIPIAAGFPFVADRIVTVAAASKAFNLAGLRCAVAHIGDERIAAKVAELPDHLLGGVSTPGAVATLAAWTEGGEWLAETVAFLKEQRDHLLARLAAELPGVRRPYPPEATYLAWLDFRACDLGDDPAAWLLEHAKVALGSGPDFGEHGKGWARLNFATTRAVLDEAIDRIVAAVG